MTEKQLVVERQHVHVFDRENGYPILDMINYVVNNYTGESKIVTNKYGKKIVSSYKYQEVGHSASSFHIYIVLNSLPKSYTRKK